MFTGNLLNFTGKFCPIVCIFPAPLYASNEAIFRPNVMRPDLQLPIYNQCLSPLMLWVPISIRARCTTICDKGCQWLATFRWFSPGPPVSSTNETDRHDITEILLKVALNTIKQTNNKTYHCSIRHDLIMFSP